MVRSLMVLFDERVQSAQCLDESNGATGGTKPVVKRSGDCDVYVDRGQENFNHPLLVGDSVARLGALVKAVDEEATG